EPVGGGARRTVPPVAAHGSSGGGARFLRWRRAGGPPRRARPARSRGEDGFDARLDLLGGHLLGQREFVDEQGPRLFEELPFAEREILVELQPVHVPEDLR